MDPLAFDLEALRRLPLAEAVLLVLREAMLPQHCLELFDRLRDHCYERKISFAVFVHLIQEALLSCQGSGRQAFAKAREQGVLTASNQCAYEKLAHVPLPLSEAFLRENSQRLLPLLPEPCSSPVPPSLRHFRVEVFDGKVTKRVAKRLKVLRGLTGGALGGKGLVSMNMHTGMVTALAASADGHANDAALVPDLIAQVRPLLPVEQQILWLGDAQFADLTQPQRFLGPNPNDPEKRDHFLLRYSAKTQFTPDGEAVWLTAKPEKVAGTDERGRRFRQEWGWLGRLGNPKRLYVRRIVLERPGETAVAVITDLLDPEKYPAEELLQAYWQRGTIEGVFQKITEVFSLEKLIACHPKGTVFQLSYCLLLFNVITVVCSHVAAGQQLPVEDVSKEMVFVDVQKQLTALLETVKDEKKIAALLPALAAAGSVRQRLGELLGGLWRPIWRKTKNKKRRAHPNKPRARGHSAVHRVLQQNNRQKTSELAASGP